MNRPRGFYHRHSVPWEYLGLRLLFMLVITMASGCAIQSPQLKDIVGEWEANNLIHSQLQINHDRTGLIGVYFDDAYICPITDILFKETDIELKLDCSGLPQESELNSTQAVIIQTSGEAIYLTEIVGSDGQSELLGDIVPGVNLLAESLVYLRTRDLQFMRNILTHRMQDYQSP